MMYIFSACGMKVPDACNSTITTVPDDFLECAGRTSGAALQSGVYNFGLIYIIIGLIATYMTFGH